MTLHENKLTHLVVDDSDFADEDQHVTGKSIYLLSALRPAKTTRSGTEFGVPVACK